jgi:hypothetical protein
MQQNSPFNNSQNKGIEGLECLSINHGTPDQKPQRVVFTNFKHTITSLLHIFVIHCWQGGFPFGRISYDPAGWLISEAAMGTLRNWYYREQRIGCEMAAD